VYTLSELARVEETLPARREISPFLYTRPSYKQGELLDIMLRGYIVREKIGAQGYVISDDSVESRIRLTEEKLGLNRDSLLEFLKGKGVTYEEYFEVIREAMEYSLFTTRIIAPLVTITEQELKNEFYKRHATDKALTFIYQVVDFSVPGEQAGPKGAKEAFVVALRDYQLTGRMSGGFTDLEANPLEGIKEDGLHPSIASALGSTPEGGFTPSVVVGGRLRSFYVKKKDLVESQAFMQNKEKLHEELFIQKSRSLTDNWFEREMANYYIRKLL
jgi:peptidyl-prolyl cis-trans isomerase SurA